MLRGIMERSPYGRRIAAIAACLQLLVAPNFPGAIAFCSHSVRIRVQKSVLLEHHRVAHKRRMPLLFSTAAPQQSVPLENAAAMEEEVPINMPNAVNRFFLGPDRGPICVLGLIVGLTVWRLLFPFSYMDSVVLMGAVVFWWFQEHLLHGQFLHSKRNWLGKEIHAMHHAKPYFHISIDPAWLMVVWLATAFSVLRLVLPLPLALSATMGYATAGLVYEWAHYIVHTRVKPPNDFWKRVRDNHIKHHLVDDRYWLSFTVPMIDDVFGTNPSVADVKTRKRTES